MVDPANGLDGVADVLVTDGRISRIGPSLQAPAGAERIDATGQVVCPGLIDLHVHFREPGQTAKETLSTGAQAAARGGFTTVVCMPNTQPSIDSASTVALIQERARTAAIRIEVSGAMSKGIQGEELASIGSLAKAGVVALTQSLAKECGRMGITVNAVCPGHIEVALPPEWDEERVKAVRREVPMRRFARPEEIAAAVFFLASAEASYITGTALKLDGGLT